MTQNIVKKTLLGLPPETRLRLEKLADVYGTMSIVATVAIDALYEQWLRTGLSQELHLEEVEVTEAAGDEKKEEETVGP